MTRAQQPEALKPCPFCGGTPELVDSSMEWFVRCNDCNDCKQLATVIYGRSVRSLDHGGTEDGLKQSAIDAWNRRAPSEQAAHRAQAAPSGWQQMESLQGRGIGEWIEKAYRSAAGEEGVIACYTASQVLAMGRVPPGWQAVPVEPTAEMVDAAEEAYMPFGDMALAIQLAVAAATRTPAAQKSLPLTDEQIDAIMQPLTTKPYSWRAFARAIERAHDIKEEV